MSLDGALGESECVNAQMCLFRVEGDSKVNISMLKGGHNWRDEPHSLLWMDGIALKPMVEPLLVAI